MWNEQRHKLLNQLFFLLLTPPPPPTPSSQRNAIQYMDSNQEVNITYYLLLSLSLSLSLSLFLSSWGLVGGMYVGNQLPRQTVSFGIQRRRDWILGIVVDHLFQLSQGSVILPIVVFTSRNNCIWKHSENLLFFFIFVMFSPLFFLSLSHSFLHHPWICFKG